MQHPPKGCGPPTCLLRIRLVRDNDPRHRQFGITIRKRQCPLTSLPLIEEARSPASIAMAGNSAKRDAQT